MFLTAVHSCKQLLTKGDIFAFICNICVHAYFNLSLVYIYSQAKFQVASLNNDQVRTILEFVTAVDSCKQLLTAGDIFAFICICVWFISIHLQNFKLLA